MAKCNISFSEEQSEYIRKIIKTDSFEKINKIANICDLTLDTSSVLQNVRDYIWLNFAKYDEKKFQTSVDQFIHFIEAYILNTPTYFANPSKDGKPYNIYTDLIPVSNGYHIANNFDYMNRNLSYGLYSIGSYLGTDRTLYLAKRSMTSKALQVSKEIISQVDYNPILAQAVFQYFNQPVAEYFLMRDSSSPYKIILSRSFLDSNQELVHLADFYNPKDFVDTYKNRLDVIEQNLSLRFSNIMNKEELQALLNKIKLQYCKQEFMKLLIGPMDSNLGNTALILTHNPDSPIPQIDISPAYDLDISFNISEDLVKNNILSQPCSSNGLPSTLESFINDFIDVPGFKDFYSDFVNQIHISPAKEIIYSVQSRTNLDYFKNNAQQYLDFLNSRFNQLLEIYQNMYLREDEEK